MKDEKEYHEPDVIQTERATIIIHRPKVIEEEKKQILERIAKIKATW